MPLGAYYANRQNQPVRHELSGLGAYYPNHQNEAIHHELSGLGEIEPAKQGLAEQTLHEILQGYMPELGAAVRPVGLFAPWGRQTGETTWQTVTPSSNVLIYPLTDALIKLAERASFGHEVGWVGVLTARPTAWSKLQELFGGRPYEFSHVEAVYRLDDSAAVPRAWYLYWATLRGEPHDPAGGQGSMEAAAQHLGGALVFPLQMPRTGQERRAPDMAAETAVNAQLAQKIPGPAATQPHVPSQSAGTGLPWWVWAAGAAGVGLVLWKRKKRS